jgi:hypothetical protein
VRAAPPATWECAEVKVRHVFKSDGDLALPSADGVDAMLRRVEAEIHAHYRPVKVRPWVMTSLGRPGEGLCTDIRRLARLRLRRPDVSRAVSVPSALQFMLHRWRAELSCALVTGDAEVYMTTLGAEVRGLGSAVTGMGRVQVYDLQSTRLAF